jgi:hypothetical protein
MELNTLLEELKSLNIQHIPIPESEENPFPRIDFPIGPDKNNVERVVQCTIQAQELFDTKSQLYRLYYTFPFKVEALATAHMARLVSFLNTHQDFPGFSYDEVEGRIFFQYTQFGLEKSQHLVAILGLFAITLSLFETPIQEIAEGRQSMNEFLEEIINTNA